MRLPILAPRRLARRLAAVLAPTPLARSSSAPPSFVSRSLARASFTRPSFALPSLVPPPIVSRVIALSLFALMASPEASAEEVGAADGLVVIAHPDLLMRSIDDEEIRRLFLGRSRRLPNGARAELASYGPAASFFNERVLALSDAQVATVWSRLRFSGRTPPPEVFDTADEVVDFVAQTPNAIAYVPTSTPRDGVRVFYSVPR